MGGHLKQCQRCGDLFVPDSKKRRKLCNKCEAQYKLEPARVSSSIVAGGVGGAVGAAVTPAVATAAVNALGFTSAGVAAGSWAAGAQGAATVSGSAFAAAQSIGATGTLAYLGSGALLVVGGGAVVGMALGIIAYRALKGGDRPNTS
jgi:hypothetical protein